VGVSHRVEKTKPLDSHLSPIRERPGSPLNAQKPSRATRKSLELLPFSFSLVGCELSLYSSEISRQKNFWKRIKGEI